MELRTYPKKRKQYMEAMEILIHEKGLAIERMKQYGEAMVNAVAKQPILTYSQFRNHLTGFTESRAIRSLFGREDPPVLYGDFERPRFYEDTISREKWIVKMIDHIQDDTLLLQLGKSFLIDFLKTGAMDGKEHISVDYDRLRQMWDGMEQYLVSGDTTQWISVEVYATMAELIYKMRHGHIDVDEYVKRVSICQYQVEMAHARYLHTYEFAYTLLDILNEAFKTKVGRVDPDRIISIYRTLHESTRAVQEVILHMPWIKSIYCCPLQNTDAMFLLLDRNKQTTSLKRKKP